MSDIVKLSEPELEHAKILQECLAKRLTHGQAAAKLGITPRHLRRLKRAFQRAGLKALASKKRGARSNNQLPTATKTRARELLQTRYADFGPTLAHEKLLEAHQLTLSRETVRQVMIADALWKPHRAKRRVERANHFGCDCALGQPLETGKALGHRSRSTVCVKKTT